MSEQEVGWSVYILRCGDGSLYTGMTNDLASRVEAHASGKGARYTRGRGPFEVVYCDEQPTRSEALRREAAIKRLSLSGKRLLAGLD